MGGFEGTATVASSASAVDGEGTAHSPIPRSHLTSQAPLSDTYLPASKAPQGGIGEPGCNLLVGHRPASRGA